MQSKGTMLTLGVDVHQYNNELESVCCITLNIQQILLPSALARGI